MNIIVIGAGKIGTSVSKYMSEKGHKVTIVEKDESVCEKLGQMKNIKLYCGDGCDPSVLENAGIKITDVVIAVTGDDEDNLVVALLTKLQPNRPKVISIINHPNDEWLFNKSWGIDAAESPTSIISRLIEKDIK